MGAFFDGTLVILFLLPIRMKVLLGRTFIDCEATLATVNRVAGCCLPDYFRRGRLPLLYVALTVLALLVFDCANGLPRQKWSVLAGPFGARLNCFGLNAGNASFDHHGLPPQDQEFEGAILWHK
jgi:hypothetical protein